MTDDATTIDTVDDERVLTDDDIAQRLEAILLVVEEPQSVISLAAAVQAPTNAVRRVIAELVREYDGSHTQRPRGFELREVGGGWRLYVRGAQDRIVSEYVNAQAPSRLSQAALETLAVIAYKQPVSRSQVAAIRAVNVDGVVRTLVARGLITELFTDAETGAINYGTTDALLTHLGINSLDELPPIAPLLDDGSDGFEGIV